MTALAPFRRFLPSFLGRTPWDSDFEAMWQRAFTDLPMTREWAPVVDVIERPEAFLVKAELPGMKAEDVHVETSGDVLRIHGERRQETKKENESCQMLERRYGAFERSLTFPTPVNSQNVEAELKDGVLTVKVMKKEAGKASVIKIKTS